MNSSVAATEMLKLVSIPGFGLGSDKLHDVGVVDTEYGHHGAPPLASGLYDVRGHVEDSHEADGARRHSLRGPDDVAGRPQAREVEADASAALLDEGHVLYRRKYALQGILDGKDVAGGQWPGRVPAPALKSVGELGRNSSLLMMR